MARVRARSSVSSSYTEPRQPRCPGVAATRSPGYMRAGQTVGGAYSPEPSVRSARMAACPTPSDSTRPPAAGTPATARAVTSANRNNRNTPPAARQAPAVRQREAARDGRDAGGTTSGVAGSAASRWLVSPTGYPSRLVAAGRGGSGSPSAAVGRSWTATRRGIWRGNARVGGGVGRWVRPGLTCGFLGDCLAVCISGYGRHRGGFPPDVRCRRCWHLSRAAVPGFWRGWGVGCAGARFFAAVETGRVAADLSAPKGKFDRRRSVQRVAVGLVSGLTVVGGAAR